MVAQAHDDFTPNTRQRIYDTVALIAGIVVPLAAIWGITIDETLVAAVATLVTSVAGGASAYLARRNVPYTGRHRAGG